MRTTFKSLIVVGLFAMVVLFQNCAPGGAKKNKASATSSSAGSPVPQGGDPCYSQFCATYFDEIDQTGLSVERYEGSVIDYDWMDGSPDPSLGVDTFSAYMYGTFDFNAGDVQFDVTADDGVRVIVDGVTIIDQYFDQGPTDYSAVVNLTGGQHMVEIYYYENGGGAVLRASWQQL